ncbi:MAG: Cd(II)/Pb(II)-responsive transcriptional regulator [Halomonas sp.]|jgi:Cd(II)/Pb(II)-responsive transcriptional regulator|uniref:Cd(II)/Pb(II)-responsive transcriptional regulator n=1 Tax=Billgrantia tianxiuensis TaxID=2497861 RepID=A0A6I6STV8_9GAMM|nr:MULTISPECIES: Cd(II)/Pb(II)-responsive transcriptional regulator [Halomonas]MCE8033634.1 Cd(II)/Pb(II)-responsive transcriptional regulator [Halomonas sp. MCCC 1A11057]MDX5432720.1 Cd(II)/Pb(II)-responsive transcriptional regulator [Halomonas sp.]QHC51225.1 Cd(II)/Pb(II)-responsive transcriptional regulator [Halomonas tianxiuensis]
MKIGELSSRTGCPVETIRYYEREGLLPEPARSSGNYRLYAEPHAERLSFIRHCRTLDMTLDEIRTLLDYHDHPRQPCNAVNGLIDDHLAHVEARIEQLQALREALAILRSRCNGETDSSHCGILQELAQPASHQLPSETGEPSHVPGPHGGR